MNIELTTENIVVTFDDDRKQITLDPTDFMHIDIRPTKSEYSEYLTDNHELSSEETEELLNHLLQWEWIKDDPERNEITISLNSAENITVSLDSIIRDIEDAIEETKVIDPDTADLLDSDRSRLAEINDYIKSLVP